MRLGRLDPETTANVGTIAGGTDANVVAEHCRSRGRGPQPRYGARGEVATEIVDHLQEAADASECDLDVTVERMFEGYRTRRPRAAGDARRTGAARLWLRARPIATGGGSDANALQAAGFACINLANGTERNHEPTERVSVDALEGMLEVAIALIEHAPALMREAGDR